MTILKVGIQTRNLRQPLRKGLATAGRIGADGVQLDLRNELPLADCSRSALREIRKLMDDYRLTTASVVFPTRRGFADEADLDRRIAATRQAMDVTAQLGASATAIRIGSIPEDEDDSTYQRLVDSLTTLGQHGDRVGAPLAIHAGGDPAEKLAKLLDQLPEASVGVDFDPAECVRRGAASIDALQTLGPHLLHVTAADAVRDFGNSELVDVPIGRGMVDFPELLAQLEPYDYRGWLTIERRESANPADEIAAAVEYLRNVQRDV